MGDPCPSKSAVWPNRPMAPHWFSMARPLLLVTAVAAKELKMDMDFFPLTVDYQEKAFAAGKIPGGFFKREGRPSEKEILTCRIIDRSIRPLFADGLRCETQIIATVLSADKENDPDVIAMLGTSVALAYFRHSV